MFKSRFFCGGSALAVTLALTAGAGPAFAQQAAAARVQSEIDKCYADAGDDDAKLAACDDKANAVTAVVSTGSRIRGLPEDAALPVETITREDLLERGSPTVLDLMRNLSEVGAVQGESNRGATGYGNNSVNLRGLGSGRTLALLNGRRLADAPNESAATSGNFQDVGSVPSSALQQVEILKDGGTTAYGADAVAGVVNFITRRDLNGMEVSGAYRFIDGSDGDPEFNVLWGRRSDSGNILLGFQYTGRGELKCMEREFCLKEPFRTGRKEGAAALVTANANPGGFQVMLPSSLGFQGFRGIGPSGVEAAHLRYVGAGTNNVFPTTSGTGTMRDQGCDEIGGDRGFNGTPSPVCYFNRGYTDNLVDETQGYQIFGDANLRVTDKIQYHTEFSARRQNLDVIQGVVDGMNNAPCEPLPATAPSRSTSLDTARNCTLSQFGSAAVPSTFAPATNGYMVPGYNPAVGDYFGRFYNFAGTARGLTATQYALLIGANPNGFVLPASGPVGSYNLASGTSPQIGALGQWLPTAVAGVAQGSGGRVALPQLSWQAFGWGGNPAFDDGLEHLQVDNYSFRTVQQLKIDIGKVFGVTLDMDVSGTYQRDLQIYQDQAILVDRLQRALNGFATNLDDPDGDTCTANETRGPRTYANVPDPDGSGPNTALNNGATVQGIAFTVGAGGGAGNAPLGFEVGANTGVDPDGTGPLASGSQVWAGNGCYFLNPFSTASAYNPFKDITPPAATATTYGSVVGPALGGSAGDYQGYALGYGLGNAPGIARWLYEERSRRVTTDNIFFDIAFNGDFAGLSLPGGPLGWAAGSQWRYVRRSTDRDRLSDQDANPCTFRTAAADPVFSPSISGTAANDQFRREDSSTCNGTNGPFTDSANGSAAYRQTRTVSYFAELALPILETVTAQAAYRWEQENQNSETGEGVGIYSGSVKWAVTPNFALRASAGDTFDPLAIPDPSVTRTSGEEILGTSITRDEFNLGNPLTEVLAIANTNLGPETGFNYNVGVIWQTPDRRLFVSLDYFDISITGQSAGVSTLAIARAATGIADGAFPIQTVLDCNNPVVNQLFTRDEAALDVGSGPRPVFGYINNAGQVTTGACRPGTTFQGDPATGEGLSIARLSTVNAGTTQASGIDGSITYRHPDEVLGGRVTVSLDATYNIKRGSGDTVFLDTVIDPAESLLGQSTGLAYNYWRGTFSFNYTRGRHAFSWQTRGFSSLRSVGDILVSSAAFNYNPADTSLCNPTLLNPAALGGLAPGAVEILGPSGVGEGLFNAACNVPYNESQRLPSTFQSDFTYRMDLPEYRASLYVTVNNAFDAMPPYWGVSFGYDTSGAIGPLGRNVKVGFTKTF